MAAVRNEAPHKSFFSSPSHTLKKLVNAFPKVQKPSLHSSGHQQEGNLYQHRQHPEAASATDCLLEEADDEEDDYKAHVSDELENDDDPNDGISSGALPVSASLAAEEDEVAADNDVDDYTEYTGSSEGEYPRPRIREDLLPHDFSAWQKSSSIAHSEASSTSREGETFSEVFSSSTSQDRHALQGTRGIEGRFPPPNRRSEHHSNSSRMEQDSHMEPYRYPSPMFTSSMGTSPAADLHLDKLCQALPDLKLDIGLSGARRYGGPAGLKGLPEDFGSLLNGASEGSRRNSVDGSCWQRRKASEFVAGGRAQEFTDMMPFIEAYRVGEEGGHQRGGNFQHHASMVYTRAPSREALSKKVADSMSTRRGPRNIRKVKKKGDGMWEEQENLPRRAKANGLSRSPRRVSYENSVEIAKLQSQVEDLQRKLVGRKDVQDSKQESSQMLLVTMRVEEMQRQVAERDRMLQAAKVEITQKEDEIETMKRRLRDTEEKCFELRTGNAKREEEVMVLRCEVAALRWQIAIDTEKRSEIETSVGVNDTDGCSDLCKQGEEPDVCRTEAVRKMYLGAIVVAQHVPREECLALVGVLRIQLQRILRIPTSYLG